MDLVTLEGILRMVESGGVVPDNVPVDLEAQARAALAGLPVPLRRSVDPALARRRRALGFIAAELARRRGESAELESLLREDWLGGGSAAPYLRLLLAVGRKDEAGAYARIAAGDPAEDPAGIDSILQDAAEAADSWVNAVQSFARDLSPDRWDDLMRFVPDETFYERTRWTFALLLRMGVDPDTLFGCATRDGVTSDAIGLAETGAASPEAIRERAGRGSRASVGLWLGLAAQSAQARDNAFLAVRLLREAYDENVPPFEPTTSARAIRTAADDELHAMLDAAGIPRFEVSER